MYHKKSFLSIKSPERPLFSNCYTSGEGVCFELLYVLNIFKGGFEVCMNRR